jgi:hypothetical protein
VKLLFENWRRDLTESEVKVSDKLSETAFNSMSAMSVFAEEGMLSEEETDQLEYEVSLAENPVSDVISKFRDSLYSGKRPGFLSYYSPEELTRMDLYLLKGHNAGFAIKEGDDIVSVHNNSGLTGLGNKFMRKAKEVGGTRLDHFDGFLSGLYRKHGFTDVYEIYQWDEQYRPEKWNYKPVDVMNSSTSVYAKALKNLVYEDPATLPNDETEVIAENEFEITINPSLKHNSYSHGRPDVIMRKLA